jgi:nitrile hydratase
MNGAQDLGGMMGFGPVRAERGEPVFHGEWERRVFGVSYCCDMLGEWNIDMGRHACESLHPAEYLASSYYEIWFAALLKNLAARDLVAPDEVHAGRSLRPAKPTAARALRPQGVANAIGQSGSYRRPLAKPALFKAGDAARARTINPQGHTRLPRYVRGKEGVVKAVRGAFVFPDAHAHGKGEDPQWL